MVRTTTRALIASLVLGIGLGFASCSENKYALIPGGSVSDVGVYFPTGDGYTSVYEVSYSNGSQTTFTSEIGRTVTVQGYEAVEWYAYDGTDVDTSYFAETDDALYYFSSRNAAPEKVLSLPLTAGHAWSRFDTYIVDRDIDTDNDGDNDDYDDYNGLKGGLEDPDEPGGPKDTVISVDSGNDDEPVFVSFPTNGSNTMVVVAIEDLTLANGQRFSGAVKLSNSGSSGTNYYWFAQGVGLVRYVFGGDQTGLTGATIGEVATYGL